MKIRRKTDHTMVVEVKAFPYLAPDRRWRKDNPQEGTTTYFSDREWEEVPAERWEVILPRLENADTRLRIIQQSDPWSLPLTTAFQLPEGYRFVQLGSAFSVEKKIS